jgi:hypothetical protein
MDDRTLLLEKRHMINKTVQIHIKHHVGQPMTRRNRATHQQPSDKPLIHDLKQEARDEKPQKANKPNKICISGWNTHTTSAETI